VPQARIAGHQAPGPQVTAANSAMKAIETAAVHRLELVITAAAAHFAGKVVAHQMANAELIERQAYQSQRFQSVASLRARYQEPVLEYQNAVQDYFCSCSNHI